MTSLNDDPKFFLGERFDRGILFCCRQRWNQVGPWSCQGGINQRKESDQVPIQSISRTIFKAELKKRIIIKVIQFIDKETRLNQCELVTFIFSHLCLKFSEDANENLSYVRTTPLINRYHICLFKCKFDMCKPIFRFFSFPYKEVNLYTYLRRFILFVPELKTRQVDICLFYL